MGVDYAGGSRVWYSVMRACTICIWYAFQGSGPLLFILCARRHHMRVDPHDFLMISSPVPGIMLLWYIMPSA